MYSDLSWYRVGIPIQGFAISKRCHDLFMHSIRKFTRRQTVRRNGFANDYVYGATSNMIRLRHENRPGTANCDGYNRRFRFCRKHEAPALEWLDRSVPAGAA